MRCLLALAVVVWLAVPAWAAERRGRRIEFSAPRGQNVLTNLEELNPQRIQEDYLKQKLQESSIRPSEVLGAGDSLSGILAIPYQPPPTPPVQNRRVRELLDLRRNWVFMSPEDFGPEPTPEKMLAVEDLESNGGQKERLSAVERFYRRLEQESEAEVARSIGRNGTKGGRDSDRQEEKSQLARRLDETENTLRRIFENNATGDLMPGADDKGLSSDIFGFGDAGSWSLQYNAAQKSRIDEFKQLLGGAPTPQMTPGLAAPASGSSGLPKPATTWAVPSAPTPPATQVSPGLSVGSGSTALPGLTPQPAQRNYTQPSAEPRRPLQVNQPPTTRKF